MLTTIATGTNIYLTADTHFHHGNIIKYCHRPFLNEEDQQALDKLNGKWHNGGWKTGPQHTISNESIHIMNNTLVNNINQTVPENATLIHLGDFSIYPKNPTNYVKNCEEIRKQIHCKNILLLWGNHDHQSIQHLFTWTGHTAKITTNNTEIILSHYPHAVWDNSHRGSLHCYGHTHADIEPHIEKLMPGRRSIDTGVDNARKILGEYRPFHIQEITNLLSQKPGYSINPLTPTNSQHPPG